MILLNTVIQSKHKFLALYIITSFNFLTSKNMYKHILLKTELLCHVFHLSIPKNQDNALRIQNMNDLT
jgi:hypothetical protein